MKIRDKIDKFVISNGYQTDIAIDRILKYLESLKIGGFTLNLSPDFQRNLVWDNQRCIDFLEYFIKGGQSGRILYFNCPAWDSFNDNEDHEIVIVDGQQRLEAFRKFLDNEIKVFGYYFKEIEDTFELGWIRININNLKTKKEVLKWYLGINAGGVPHTKEDIEKVEKMLNKEN